MPNSLAYSLIMGQGEGATVALRWRLLVPVAALLTLSVLLISGLVLIAARGQNQISLATQVHVAQSGIEAELDRLANLTVDYAWWDEAVESLLMAPDASWADRNIGSFLHHHQDVQLSFVVDADGRTLFGMRDGKPLSEPASVVLGNEFSRMLDAARAESPLAVKGIKGVLPVEGRPHLVVAAPLTHEPGSSATMPADRRGVLILGREIDTDMVSRLAGRFGLDGLALTGIGEPLPQEGHLTLRSPGDIPLGSLSWRPQRPGDDLVRSLLPALLAAIALLGFLTLRVVAVWNGAVRRLDRVDRHLSAVLDQAADAIVGVGIDGRITGFNGAAESLFGLSSAAALGRSIDTLLCSSEVEGGEAGLAARMVERTGGTGVAELFALRRDGTRVPVELSYRLPDRSPGSQAVLILRDVSERRAIERALREAKEAAEMANRAKTEFVANMSHELRTPLNAILGFSDMISQEIIGPVGNPQYRAYAKDINSSGQHLLSMVEDILDFSRIESGRAVLERSEGRISALFEAALRIYGDRIREAGLRVEWRLEDPGLRVTADLRKVKQMLANLLSNAVKFTPRGGVIRLEQSRTANGGVELAIADTGLGIPENKIELVQQPFAQTDSSTCRVHGGTGLGLALTKALIELHNGRLHVQSKVGEGTRAVLIFPADCVVAPRAMVEGVSG